METNSNFFEIEHNPSFRYLALEIRSPIHQISWSNLVDEDVEFDFLPNLNSSSTDDIIIFCRKIMKPCFDFEVSTLQQSTNYDQNSPFKVSSSVSSSLPLKKKLHKVLIWIGKDANKNGVQ
ncbi:hypothetical protein M5689_001697 [Euphorbia peplus]|nr:hypothetical protein M5689_001697 [Euphorbia peplus]